MSINTFIKTNRTGVNYSEYKFRVFKKKFFWTLSELGLEINEINELVEFDASPLVPGFKPS